MNKEKIVVVAALIALIAIGAMEYMLPQGANTTTEKTIESIEQTTNAGTPEGSETNIQYEGHVDIWKIPAQGEPIYVSGDNLLVDLGKEYIKAQIGSGASTASNSTKYISLSNDGTAPAAGWTQIPSEINANGLSRATSTYADNGTGAWNYTYTWTATASQSAQLTGLQWSATPVSDGNLFAALQFPVQSLLINDQLKVVWSISIT